MTATANSYTGKADQIREYANNLGDILSSPGFLEIVEELETAPQAERPEILDRVASVEAFRDRGIPTPEGLRVAPRVFEDPNAAWQTKEYQPFDVEGLKTQPTPEAGFCVSFGIYLCASYGN